MSTWDRRPRIALLAGLVFLAVLGFGTALVHAHGHGGGHGGSHGHGGLGGHHHGAHPHTHYHRGAHGHPGLYYDSHYHHDHDDYGDHFHPCRPISGANADWEMERNDPFNQECLNHAGEWEPSWGD